MLTMTIGLRGRDEHKSLRFQDLKINTNENGKEYMNMYERVTKTRDGSDDKNLRKTMSRYFCTCASGQGDCLIEFVKKFTQKKPAKCCQPNQPFYWTPIPSPKHQTTDPTWYYVIPLGKNKIGSLLPDACEKAGLERRSNHGARRTAIKRMRKSGVPDAKICKITGHKSVHTLSVYDDELSDDEHFEIQKVIQGGSACRPTPMNAQRPRAAGAPDTALVQAQRNNNNNNVSNTDRKQMHLTANATPSLSSQMMGMFQGTIMNQCTINVFSSSQSHQLAQPGPSVDLSVKGPVGRRAQVLYSDSE